MSRFISRTASVEADHHRPGDDAVADVQLVHVRDGGDGPDVAVGQAVAGVERQPRLADEPPSLAEDFKLDFLLPARPARRYCPVCSSTASAASAAPLRSAADRGRGTG